MIARQLDQDDVSTFRALRLASLKDEPDNFGSTYEDWHSRPDAELRAFLKDEPIFAAFDGDQPVGLTGLIPEKKSKQAHRWGLAMVYVAPEARGSGAAVTFPLPIAAILATSPLQRRFEHQLAGA